jgi:AcrR family transcriptional regulator
MGSVTITSPTVDRRRRPGLDEEVLSAVQKLLMEGHRYTELPVQRILSEAQVARSTFYHRYPDKSQLLIRLAELGMPNMLQAGWHWWKSDDHSEGLPGLVRVMADMIAESRAHRHLLRAVGEVSGYDREVARYWRGRIKPFEDLAEARLRSLRAEGRVNPDIATAETASIVIRMTERSIAHHLMTDDGEGDDGLANALARTVWLCVYGDARAMRAGHG